MQPLVASHAVLCRHFLPRPSLVLPLSQYSVYCQATAPASTASPASNVKQMDMPPLPSSTPLNTSIYSVGPSSATIRAGAPAPCPAHSQDLHGSGGGEGGGSPTASIAPAPAPAPSPGDSQDLHGSGAGIGNSNGNNTGNRPTIAPAPGPASSKDHQGGGEGKGKGNGRTVIAGVQNPIMTSTQPFL